MVQEKGSSQGFNFKDAQGVTHSIDGNPDTLTLQDAWQRTGQKGGERGSPRFRVGTREYSGSELQRPLSELGIRSGSMIEIVPE